MSEADVRLAAEVIQTRAAGRHLLLLSDFDGTLCEFHTDPEAVWLTPSRRALLEEIASDPGATLAIVSGRRLEDVRRRTTLGADTYFAGVHGLEIEGGGDRYRHPAFGRTETLLRGLAEPVASDLAALDGAFLENKGPSLVVHFRGASVEDGARAEATLLRHAKPHLDAGVLRTMRGAFMLELMPNIEWHKGCAVNWILDHVIRQYGDAWPLYIGDDLTDEDGFRAVREHGLSVAASPRAGDADFAVDGPPEVEALLRVLARQLTKV
jgi:trehalose 6-phosphate phosphatase